MALDKVKLGVLDGASTGVKSDRYTIPSITTSQRDAGSFSAAVGDLIYNSTIGNLQQYTSTGWASVAAPPAITGVTYPTESGAVLTALDATGSSDAAQTLIINGSNFTSTVTVEILVGGTYSAFSSSVSVNGARNQVTCTGVTKRAAADNYTLRVTNSTGLDATTTVNFSADPSFSTAANLGSVFAGDTLSKSIAFTGTKVIQGATAKPTWMTVTGATSTADNGSGDTTFDATGSPVTLGGTIVNSGTSQVHTFSIVVRDAENQTFNRDFSLTAVDMPTGGTSGSGSATLPTTTIGGVTYRYHAFLSGTSNFQVFADLVCDILIVAGGGGSAQHVAGGGGGGGIVTMMNYTILTGTASVTVGNGGTGSTARDSTGGKGADSSIVFPQSAGTQTVQGGGGSGGWDIYEGGDGANGGGDGVNNSSSHSNNTGGAGLAATGSYALLSQSGATITYFGDYNGGNTSAFANAHYHPAAGGGGATAHGGTPPNSQSDAGDGGDGKQITWVTPDALGFTSGSGTHNGVSYNTGFYFSGGGGGAIENTGVGGDGGKGGGGGGSHSPAASSGTDGVAGTGGINNASVTTSGNANHGGVNTGGGAGGNYNGSQSNGGSGIVVIRYPI